MKFNQFLLAPYFGPGLLPHEQTLWIDDLAVGTKRLGAATARSPSRNDQAPMRVAAAQPRNRTIDFRLKPSEVLARVDQSLAELEQLVHKAGAAGCGALALPEDTLGLLKWESANPGALDAVLPEAVRRMLDRLGKAASRHPMYLVVCNDAIETDGRTYNTAFLLGRDGREIGRYHKVNLPLTEQGGARGREFPVFPAPDLGTVGMLICYDMVFPEAARCLALRGADIVFHPTLGGAAIGDDDISLAAFRTRAGGELRLPGRGDARPGQHDHLAAREDPRHRERARWTGHRRHRSVRRRARAGTHSTPSPTCAAGCSASGSPVPTASSPSPNPPVLAKVPSNVTSVEAVRIMATVLTTGEERFNKAEALARAGKTEEAIRLYERLCEECRTSWIDRAARERLRRLRTPGATPSPKTP